MTKSYFNIKKIVAILLTATCLIQCMLFYSVASTDEYVKITGYKVSDTVYSVDTREMFENTTQTEFKWTLGTNNTLVSGNSHQKKTVSILKITVQGSGSLVFKYKIASGSTKNSFVVSTDSKLLDNLGNFYTYISNNTAKNERKYGEIDWAWKTIPVNAEEKAYTTIYLIYKTGNETCKSDDCVTISDLRFSNGKVRITASSNNILFGNVSGTGDYNLGETASLTANETEGSKFYGWVVEGKLVSRENTYSIEAASDTTATAMFGKESDIVAENILTGSIYTSVKKALEEAKTGETIWLLQNTSISEKVTVPDGVTLYIPFEDNFESIGSKNGNLECSPKFATADKAYKTLTVNESGTLEVKGVLQIGAVIGYPSQQYQGHTSGAYGLIENNGSVVIDEGAVLDCYGFIEGTGSVKLMNGAKAFEPFIVYDYSGGSNTLALEQAGQSPFTQYTMQNIRCAFVINSGSILYGRCNLYASSEFNKTDAVIIGDSETGGILQLSEGASLTRTVDNKKTCESYCSDIGRVNFEIDGGASLNALTMVVMGVTVSTSDVLFPMTYNSSFDFTNGTYAINTGIVLMPGAEMTVGADAELNVNDSFYVLDGLRQGDISGKSYPATETLTASGFSAGGSLIVNGKMNLNAGVDFGGIIQSKQKGAVVVTAKKTGEEVDDLYDNTITLGGEAVFSDNTSIIDIKARIFDGEKFIKLESGKEYIFNDTKEWILPSYSMEKYTMGETVYTDVTVEVNSKMFGYGSEKKEDSLLGDLDFDGRVNSIDATIMQRYLAKIITLNEAQLKAADLNGDGHVNSIDATIMQRYLAKLITMEDIIKMGSENQ